MRNVGWRSWIGIALAFGGTSLGLAGPTQRSLVRSARAESGAAVPPDLAEPSGDVASAPVAPSLPEGVDPFVSTEVPVPGDKAVLVIHAPADNRRAILYMHGMCGNARAVEGWRAAAARHGTLIALIGDTSCGRGRFKWSKTVESIQVRLSRALEAVAVARGGLLDTSQVVLFGYSQGADRASVLARRYPDKYRRVVLGGPSHEPRLENLGDTEAVAVFGGQFESTWHMRNGAEVLSAAGKPARFFLLPRAKHGEYGPEGNRVMDEVLSWVVEAPDNG